MRSSLGAAIFAWSTLAACSSFEAAEPGLTPDGGVTDGSASASGPRGGLVLAYDFEGPSEVSASDTSGRGNDGTIFAGKLGAGVHGKALEFRDATSGGGATSVTVPPSASLDLGGDAMTIAFWISIALPLPAGDQVVLGKAWATGKTEPPTYQYGVEVNHDARSIQLFVGASDGVPALRAEVTPAFGAWCHVAFVVGGGSVVGYVNGVASPPSPMAGGITARGTALSLGVDPAGSQPFVGALDEVRIYDRALSADEIAQLAAR